MITKEGYLGGIYPGFCEPCADGGDGVIHIAEGEVCRTALLGVQAVGLGVAHLCRDTMRESHNRAYRAGAQAGRGIGRELCTTSGA